MMMRTVSEARVSSALTKKSFYLKNQQFLMVLQLRIKEKKRADAVEVGKVKSDLKHRRN